METIEPLNYIYDPAQPEERQSAILAQVKAYCQIPEGQADAVTWSYIWQVIRRLSVFACWADNHNDTFILQTRTQQFSAKQVNKCCRGCCRCDEDIVKVPLEYEPVVGYISGSISVVIGGRVVTQEIPLDYLNEHTDWETGILYINREDFPNILMYHGDCCCLCNRDLRIKLVYNAGFEALPVGILPVVCHLINTIDTDTSDNCVNTMTTTAGLLKRKKVGNVEYEWSDKDDSTYTVNKLTAELSALGVLGEVMALSRCAIADDEPLTGAVV